MATKKAFFRLLAFSGLALTIVPALLVFSGQMSMQMHRHLMFAGFLLWFAAAPKVLAQ